MEDTIQKRKKSDNRINIYVRIDPRQKARFKAIADLAEENMEDRIGRLMCEDVEANRHLLIEAATA